jgi:hypothetical protein
MVARLSISPIVLSLTLAVASPSHAFQFVLVSPGSDQHLNWHWETGYPSIGCQNNQTPCGDIASINGTFSSSFTGGAGFRQRTLSGGTLSWTGDDSLKIVATALVSARASNDIVNIQPGYADAWAALNARDFPLSFTMHGESGDPPTTNLKITPRLLGSFVHNTTLGATSSVLLQTLALVEVNGIQATADTLYTNWAYDDGADGTRVLQFPKGEWNTVMLPNVPVNSLITVTLWNYARPSVTVSGLSGDLADIYAFSTYGDGPAISVVAQPMGVVGVGEGMATPSISLRAAPNPSSGATTIRFALPAPSHVHLSIYDVTGHRVALLAEADESAGDHDVVWNGRSARGDHLPAGVYLVQLVTGGVRHIRKLILLDS